VKRAAAVHAAANALLLWCGYYWLGVGESRASSLAWSIFLALAVVVLTCWTYGASFVSLRSGVAAAWRMALRNLLPLIAAAALVAAVYILLARWADYSAEPVFKIASYLTWKLRKPVRPATMQRIFDWALWAVQWIVFPVLVLPMLAAISARGWRGWGGIGAKRRRLYWLAAPALLLCAFAAPMKLLGWAPHFKSFGMEMTSFVFRAAAAYLLFIMGWLALAFVTSNGSPRETHPNTVVSP
jgi:hypothetical protein